MRRVSRILVVGTTALAAAATARPGEEKWIATSTAGMAITGDIILSPRRLRTEHADFPLRVISDVPNFGGQFGPVPARVLAVTRPKNPVLLNGNRLCRRPVRWIVVSHLKDGGLELDAFESRRMPTSIGSTGSCGSLFYSRPDR